jgi:hypothetical protein
VPSFLKKSTDIKLLEWFDTIHFVEDCIVPRNPVPVISHANDSQVPAIMAHDFTDPVVQFTVGYGESLQAPSVNLWRQETRAVVPMSAGAGRMFPLEAKLARF